MSEQDKSAEMKVDWDKATEVIVEERELWSHNAGYSSLPITQSRFIDGQALSNTLWDDGWRLLELFHHEGTVKAVIVKLEEEEDGEET